MTSAITPCSIVKCWLGSEGAVKNTIVGREMSIKEKGDIFVSPRYMPSCWMADKTQFENSTRERKRRWRFKGLVKYQVKDYFQFFWAKFLLFGSRINLKIRKWPFLRDRNDIVVNIKHDNFEQKVHGFREGPFVNAHMANFSHSCLSRC